MKYDPLMLREMARIFMIDRQSDGDKSREMLERLKSEHGYSASKSMSLISRLAGI